MLSDERIAQIERWTKEGLHCVEDVAELLAALREAREQHTVAWNSYLGAQAQVETMRKQCAGLVKEWQDMAYSVDYDFGTLLDCADELAALLKGA